MMASTMNDLVDLDSTELDRLIHNLEYENQQCVKMIEKNDQVISSLSSQIEHKVQEKIRLEEEISKFDDDTRRLHRNFTNNRDNIACLKNTMSVMSDHMDALSKQLSTLQIKTSEESKTYNEHVTNYSKTRDEYMAKYRSFPWALNLEKAQKVVQNLQAKVQEIGEKKNKIAEQISTVEEVLSTKVMTRIVMKMAKIKVITHGLESEIHECVTQKTILLEQLKELQKSKHEQQEVAIVTEDDGSKSSKDVVDDTPSNEIEEIRMSDETDQLTCNTSVEETYKHLNEISKTKNPTHNLEKNDNLDVDGDVLMEEVGPSAQKCDQPAPFNAEELPCPQPEIIKASVKRNLPTFGDHFGKAPNVGGNNISKPQQTFPYQKSPGFGMLPKLSLPRTPSLSRMPVPLRFPSLNVPRPLRMQQPRFMSGFQKKTPSVSSNAGDSNVPQMKEPSPPPLKVPTPPTRNNKEKSSLPQFGFLKGNLPQPKAVTSASSATNFTLGQQLSMSSKSKIAEPEQRDRSQVIQNIQSEMPEPEPYFMPLNDVGNEPMALDEDMENKTDTNGKRGSGYTHEAKKRTDFPQTQKKISLPSAVCLDKEGTTGEGNEPVFKLVHTFGNQDFLGSNGASSQPNSEKDVELLHGQFSDKATTSVSPKCSLISHLDAMSSMGDSCSPENDKERASIFDFFDISQKANSGNDTDAVEDGDSFRSIFNFKSTDADDSNSDNDTEASRGGYFGTSGLLGMVSGGVDQSDQAEESGAFHLNLGLSKDTDEDCSDQPSFFNFNNFI